MEINSMVTLIGIAFVVAVAVIMKALFNTNKETNFQEKTEEAESKKIFKLFNYEGTLIKEYRDVYDIFKIFDIL
ncbi:hypothetical protein KKC15_06620 [bacterium]|nr:hypothetical protein [bacterium]